MELKHVGMFQRGSSRGLAWPSSPPLLGHGICSDGTTVVSAAFFCLWSFGRRDSLSASSMWLVQLLQVDQTTHHTTLVGWTAKSALTTVDEGR